MVAVVVSLMAQKFLPLRTFYLSQAQTMGGCRGLQSKVIHPKPSGLSLLRRAICTPRQPPSSKPETHPSLNLRITPPGWDSYPPLLPTRKLRLREAKGLVHADSDPPGTLLSTLGAEPGAREPQLAELQAGLELVSPTAPRLPSPPPPRAEELLSPSLTLWRKFFPLAGFPQIPSSTAGNCLPKGPLTSWQHQQMWKPRLGSEQADRGRQAGLAPDTLCQCSQRAGHFIQAFSKQRGQVLSPILGVGCGGKGGSDDDV